MPPAFIAAPGPSESRDARVSRTASLQSTPASTGKHHEADFVAWREQDAEDGKEKKHKKSKGFGSIFKSSKKRDSKELKEPSK